MTERDETFSENCLSNNGNVQHHANPSSKVVSNGLMVLEWQIWQYFCPVAVLGRRDNELDTDNLL